MSSHDAQFARTFLTAVRTALDAVSLEQIGAVVELLERACRDGRSVFVAGNGGSAATASHFASDLAAAATDCASQPRVTCMSDNAARLTALANDHGFSEVFRRPLLRAARPGDVVVLFTVSGVSENVVRAVDAARERGATSVGIFGSGRTGRDHAAVDQAIIVPSEDFAVVESVHNALEHLLAMWTGARLRAEA